ncbi:MAG: DUF6457 domain-containing protein [Actinomycetota bacterium]|jgi:hypothetical protein|nr:DUF6457 domain-containing protein [Actinomycetota bacterium]
MAIPASEWLERYAQRLGVPPLSTEEIDALLAAAGVAAHSSERTAAPVTCYLAARAGCSPSEALDAARDLSAKLDD